MMPIILWINTHPVQSTLAAKAIWDSIVGSLPAPTKDSSSLYVFSFKFLNSIAFNFHRARSTAIENSPNFLAAVQNYIMNLPPGNIDASARGSRQDSTEDRDTNYNPKGLPKPPS